MTTGVARPEPAAWNQSRSAERRVVESLDPATGEVWRSHTVLGGSEVRGLMDVARRAHPAWAAMAVRERARVLARFQRVLYGRRHEVADLIRRENGKAAPEALATEVMVVLDLAATYAALARRELVTRTLTPRNIALWRKRASISYQPLGVVGVISPWNYPFMLPAGVILPALVAGNAVLFKPSELTPSVGSLLVELLHEAGVPEGVMQLCTGDGATGAALTDAAPDKVFFTGSVATGKRVARACAERLIPCVLELGGSDPAIVLSDADIENAASGIAWGRFSNAGQTCVAPKRAIVVDEVYDRFLAALASVVGNLRVGPASNPDNDVGPMIRPSQLDQIEEQLHDAIQRGARVVVGGSTEGDGRRFFKPTVLADVTPDMRVMREETFGPLLPVIRVRDANEAIAVANSSEFGLSASVWSRNSRRATEVAKRIEAGSVILNDAICGVGIAEVPHSGVKSSGHGSSHGLLGLLECVRPKVIVADYLPSVRQPWWFGYDGSRRRQVDAFMRLWYGSSVRERASGIAQTLKLVFRPSRPL
ncbi:MAG: aldehyde dehydrogenase family protein [Gemmatimonadaceae bacterium]